MDKADVLKQKRRERRGDLRGAFPPAEWARIPVQFPNGLYFFDLGATRSIEDRAATLRIAYRLTLENHLRDCKRILASFEALEREAKKTRDHDG